MNDVTFEEMQRACEAIVRAWNQFTMTVQEAAECLGKWAEQIDIDIWALLYPEEKKFKSPKHAYHFPSKRRHVKSKLICAYAPVLKPPRNLPYQRRNY